MFWEGDSESSVVGCEWPEYIKKWRMYNGADHVTEINHKVFKWAYFAFYCEVR